MPIVNKHVIVDMIVADSTILEHADMVQERVESVIKDKVNILSWDFHDFGPNCGVTMIWMLAESHVSLHTWPEESYMALDIFTCGEINPEDFVEPLVAAFNAVRYTALPLERKPPVRLS